MIIHIHNKQEFENEISNHRCLVDFYTTWCGPCKMLSPIIEELDQDGSLGDTVVLKIDAEECADLSREFRIQTVPTLLLIENKIVKQAAYGYLNENELLNFIK